MQLTLPEYIEKKRSKQLAYIATDTDRQFGWEQISSLELNIPANPKKLCFLYADNSISSICALFSTMRDGHCICPLSRDLKIELKENLEKNYQPGLIIDSQRDQIQGYDKLELKAPDGQSISLFTNAGVDYTVHPDLCILLPTSGTTGSPKFVKLTHENLVSNVDSVIQYLPINENDSAPLNLPIYYSYGLSVLLTNSAAGGKIICTNESVLSRNFWNQFVQYQCNNFAGVPYTYEMLHRIGFTGMQGFSLKYFTQAGGKLDVKYRKIYAEYALEHKAQFFVMYGQTEAGPRMSYLEPEYGLSKIDSIGKPVPGGSFAIDGGTGELLYRGKNVFKGYAYNYNDLNTLENTAELRTGDLARVDEDGFYYIIGRLNRFVKLFGNRLGLDEVEQQLRKKFEGSIGCAGSNDTYLLIFSDNLAINADEIRNYASTLYGIHISAIRYKLLPAIPLNSNQKINYQQILKEYDS